VHGIHLKFYVTTDQTARDYKPTSLRKSKIARSLVKRKFVFHIDRIIRTETTYHAYPARELPTQF